MASVNDLIIFKSFFSWIYFNFCLFYVATQLVYLNSCLVWAWVPFIFSSMNHEVRLNSTFDAVLWISHFQFFFEYCKILHSIFKTFIDIILYSFFYLLYHNTLAFDGALESCWFVFWRHNISFQAIVNCRSLSFVKSRFSALTRNRLEIPRIFSVYLVYFQVLFIHYVWIVGERVYKVNIFTYHIWYIRINLAFGSWFWFASTLFRIRSSRVS